MGIEICLYKGTRDDSATEVCIIDPLIYPKKYIPINKFCKENIDAVIKEFRQIFIENDVIYAGISDTVPKIDNGYKYSKIEDEILDEMRKMHPAPSNGYGCTVHPIRQRDPIEEYYASLEK